MASPLSLPSSGLRVEREALPEVLQPFVAEIYAETVPEVLAGPFSLPVSAFTRPLLNVCVTGRQWVEIGDGFWAPRVVIAGPQPEAYTVEAHGRCEGFFVVFEPTGPLALFGVRGFWRGETDPPDLAETVRPALAPAARAYAQALLAAPSFDARAALTLSFCTEALAGAPASDLDRAALLREAVGEIERTGGQVRMSALAERIGVTPNTLRRRFRALGISAKRFAEIVRFRHAHAHLHSVPGATFAETALEFGYADQPHFARDYRRFSGAPPTKWLHDARIIDRRMGIEGRFDPDDA